MDRLIEFGVTSKEELASMKNAFQKWQELPGAFFTMSYCEEIGRKAQCDTLFGAGRTQGKVIGQKGALSADITPR